MQAEICLPTIGEVRAPSITEVVFDTLYERLVDLRLRPGTLISEGKIAKEMQVSRQPVRDAFYRLSQLGFLEIRPQQATIVTRISEKALSQAVVVRTALEMESIRVATQRHDLAGLDQLDEIVKQQEVAVAADQRLEFHTLDDLFHKKICEIAELDFMWEHIKNQKGQMDRGRYLSISKPSDDAGWDENQIFRALRARDRQSTDDHRMILASMRDQDTEGSIGQMRTHLSRIYEQIGSERIAGLDIFEP